MRMRISSDERYFDGTDTFGVTSGTIVFKLPENSPNVLYYVSENDINAVYSEKTHQYELKSKSRNSYIEDIVDKFPKGLVITNKNLNINSEHVYLIFNQQ